MFRSCAGLSLARDCAQVYEEEQIMLRRLMPMLVVVVGLGVLAAGNLGGCPCYLANCLLPGSGGDTVHEKIFVDVLSRTEYEGTADSCLICHDDHARDILEAGHWNWEGTVTNIEGLEGQTYGKRDLLNNL